MLLSTDSSQNYVLIGPLAQSIALIDCKSLFYYETFDSINSMKFKNA